MVKMRLNEKEKVRFEKAISEYCNTQKSARQISREFNFGKDRVTNYLKRNGLLRPKKDNSYNKQFFSTIDNEEKAYWLGFLYADGSITQGSRNSVDLTLSSKDEDHLYKFKTSLNYKGDIKQRKIKGRYKASRVTLHGEEIVLDLIRQGCVPNKSLILKYPSIPKVFNKHFIRGYFDGDGSVYTYKAKGCKTPKLCLSIIGNFDFLNVVQSILIEEINTREVKLYNDKKTVWEYKKAWNEAYKVLDYLYSDSNIYLTRKKEIFTDYCRQYR